MRFRSTPSGKIQCFVNTAPDLLYIPHHTVLHSLPLSLSDGGSLTPVWITSVVIWWSCSPWVQTRPCRTSYATLNPFRPSWRSSTEGGEGYGVYSRLVRVWGRLVTPALQALDLLLPLCHTLNKVHSSSRGNAQRTAKINTSDVCTLVCRSFCAENSRYEGKSC